jgi:hypothetical protein
VLLSFAAKDHNLEGPRSGPDSLFVPHLKGYEIAQRRCSPQGARPFLHPFCGRLDKKNGVWRDATRRFCFDLKSKEQQMIDLLLCDYRKKQPHNRSDR